MPPRLCGCSPTSTRKCLLHADIRKRSALQDLAAGARRLLVCILTSPPAPVPSVTSFALSSIAARPATSTDHAHDLACGYQDLVLAAPSRAAASWSTADALTHSRWKLMRPCTRTTSSTAWPCTRLAHLTAESVNRRAWFAKHRRSGRWTTPPPCRWPGLPAFSVHKATACPHHRCLCHITTVVPTPRHPAGPYLICCQRPDRGASTSGRSVKRAHRPATNVSPATRHRHWQDHEAVETGRRPSRPPTTSSA